MFSQGVRAVGPGFSRYTRQKEKEGVTFLACWWVSDGLPFCVLGGFEVAKHITHIFHRNVCSRKMEGVTAVIIGSVVADQYPSVTLRRCSHTFLYVPGVTPKQIFLRGAAPLLNTRKGQQSYSIQCTVTTVR